MRLRDIALVTASAGMLTLSGCAMTRPEAPDGPESPAAPAPANDRPDPNPRYSGGRAMQDFPAPAGAVAAAVLEAMADLKITVARRDHDGPAAQIDGKTPDNRTVTVTLRPQKPITHVSCRVSWFGDEPLSRALLRRVAVRLGTIPPEAIPETVPSAPAPNPYFSRDAVPDAEMMRDFLEAPYRSRPDI